MKDNNTTRIVSIINIILGCLLSAGIYAWDDGSSSVLYWGILPGLPFVLISCWAFFHKGSTSPSHIIGASITCVGLTILAYGSIYYESAHYSGGGANIGFGILLLPLPLYYLVAAFIGWKTGGRFAPEAEQRT